MNCHGTEYVVPYFLIVERIHSATGDRAGERHGLAHTIPGAVHPGSRTKAQAPVARFGGWVGSTVVPVAQLRGGGC